MVNYLESIIEPDEHAALRAWSKIEVQKIEVLISGIRKLMRGRIDRPALETLVKLEELEEDILVTKIRYHWL